METIVTTVGTAIAALLTGLTLYFSSLKGLRKQNAAVALDTRSELDDIKAIIASLRNENTQLKNQVEQLNNTLEVLRSEGRQTIIDYTTALRDLLKARMELASVEKQYIEASGKAALLDIEKAALVVANGNLSKELTDNSTVLKESQTANNVARQTIEDLTVQKAKLEGEIVGLEKGYTRMQFILMPIETTKEEIEEETDI